MFHFHGTLERIFINSYLGLFSLCRLQLHEQIVLHSNTPASRYSTVSFGSHSQINTTWTRRHKQLISASSSSSSYAVWRIVLFASSIFKDFHISQKVTLSPRVKHTKKAIRWCDPLSHVQLLPTGVCLHVNSRQMLSRNCSSAGSPLCCDVSW